MQSFRMLSTDKLGNVEVTTEVHMAYTAYNNFNSKLHTDHHTIYKVQTKYVNTKHKQKNI